MGQMPGFRLGDKASCKRCQTEFSIAHPKQKFCSPLCAETEKKLRPRKRTNRKEYNKNYREKNFLAIETHRKAYYEKNKKLIAEKQKQYRQALPREIVLQRRARSYEQHREHEMKRYHATRTWLPWLNAFRGSKQRAKKHNIPFALTKEWAQARWNGRCEVTDISFVLSQERNPYLFSPSLDRIVPSKGYTPDNSRFVLHAVNALKGAGTDTQMLQIAKAIVDAQKAAPERFLP